MYDLTVILPLYGKDCEDVSLRMVSSLALQKTQFNVKYLFYFDKTVSVGAIYQIESLFRRRHPEKDYDIIYSNETCSGYKRNLGLKFAEENSKYVWLVDQDDYIISDDVIEIVLKFLLGNNERAFKISFATPDYLDEENNKIIHSIPTMPWQYIVRTDLIKGYRFREDGEYGSDVPFSIRFLVMNDYMKVNDDLTVSIKTLMPQIRNNLYFYNYLNPNSYMSTHLYKTETTKEDEREYAYSEIRKVKEEYENR